MVGLGQQHRGVSVACSVLIAAALLPTAVAGTSQPGRGGAAAAQAALGGARVTISAQDLADLLAALDADDFEVRERAQQRLLDDPRVDLATIGRLLTGQGADGQPAELSPEQRRRIEQAAVLLFRMAPRAGMGVQFDTPPAARGILITRTVETFPAAKILKERDVILEAGERVIDTTEAFQRAILSYRPGETMRAKVLREGEEIELDIPLGSFEDLSGAMPPPPDVLLGAMRDRFARESGEGGDGEAGGEEATVIAAGLGAEAWAPPEDDAARQVDGHWALRTVATEVAVGGRPWTGVEPRDWRRWVVAEGEGVRDAALEAMDVEAIRQRESQFLRLRTATVTQLVLYQRLIDDGELDPQQRDALRAVLESQRAELASLDQSLRAVQAELERRGQVPEPMPEVVVPPIND